MGGKFNYATGSTPLDADEFASLIPRHLTKRSELKEWERLNILQGEAWAREHRADIFDETFIRQLHRQMFGQTWHWAGEFRKSDKNILGDWLKIRFGLRNLFDEVRYKIDHSTCAPDEIAVCFHHRLVAIHLFSYGNGRHARLMADLLAERLGQPRFTWGNRTLVDAGETRQRYIAALQAADARDYAPLLAFARG
jgi:Fic-DOC domain mobile mystery protein B